MESDERDFKERDFEWRGREFKQRDRHNAEHKTLVRWTAFLSTLTIVISLAALSATIIYQERQSRTSTEQFQESLRRDEYGQIVAGLSSSSAAVQDSSMRRLVAYVQRRDNYSNDAAQQEGVENAIQTLAAFIADESVSREQTGLSLYQNPQPIIVPRAMQRLKQLASSELGTVVVDVSRADLHGAYLPEFRPSAHILATGADFRRANLSSLNLEADRSPSSLNSAFFTCANLSNARLGAANLAGTDLTGADLSGADLSRVTGLEYSQMHGVTISESTRLPSSVSIRPRRGWIDSDRCYTLVNSMTGMRGAQGYFSSLPCPPKLKEARKMEIEPPWEGGLTDLISACRLRNRTG